jgi:DNA-binding transcriptional LysR family regulator
MPRNLDLTALRSFAAVADAGGVTRASGFLNLTQSAVSMQVKRLEDSLGLQLLDRAGRGVVLTAAGEQLLGYARKMLALNDEAWSRLTCESFEGEVVLGVPHDIVYPVIPGVLQRFAAEFPRMRVQLLSSFTRTLKEDFAKGEADLILTTEDRCDPSGETLAEVPLLWVGAPGGTAWRHRPLRLAFEERCIFRPGVTAALDRAGIPWEMAVTTSQTRVTEATVSADLAVHAALEGACPPYMQPVSHGGALPDLPVKKINLYLRDADRSAPLLALAEMVREGYRRRESARRPARLEAVPSAAAS